MSRAAPRYRRDNQNLGVVTPSLFRVTIVGECEKQECINTFYYHNGGAALNNGTEANFANDFWTSFGTTWLACVSADYAVDGIKVECITTPSRIPFTKALAPPTNGTAPATHNPLTVAVVMSRLSNTRGQCGRGRIYVPAVPLAWTTDTELTNIANFLALESAMIANIVSGAATFTPQVFSGGSRTHPVPGMATVQHVNTKINLATVRRRRPGRGK